MKQDRASGNRIGLHETGKGVMKQDRASGNRIGLQKGNYIEREGIT